MSLLWFPVNFLTPASSVSAFLCLQSFLSCHASSLLSLSSTPIEFSIIFIYCFSYDRSLAKDTNVVILSITFVPCLS